MMVFSEEPAPAHDTVDNDKASARHGLVDEFGRCVEISEYNFEEYVRKL